MEYKRASALTQVLQYHENSEYRDRALWMYRRLIESTKATLIASLQPTADDHEPLLKWILTVEPDTVTTTRVAVKKDWIDKLQDPQSMQLFSDLCTLITEVERINVERDADMQRTIRTELYTVCTHIISTSSTHKTTAV